MNVVAQIKSLVPGVAAARDARLARRRELLEAPVPPPAERSFAKDCHCHDCRTASAASEAHAAALHQHGVQLAALEREIRDTRPSALRALEGWLQREFDVHRGRALSVEPVRSVSNSRVRSAKSNARWLQATARLLIDAQREAADVLVYVPSAELPARIAAVQQRAAAALAEETFEEMSPFAISRHFDQEVSPL